MLLLVDEAKRSSRGREIKICIQRRKSSIRTKLFLDFLKTFSLKNKGFGVLKNEKGYFFIFFKDLFVEERRIWSSKKQKKGFS